VLVEKYRERAVLTEAYPILAPTEAWRDDQMPRAETPPIPTGRFREIPEELQEFDIISQKYAGLEEYAGKEDEDDVSVAADSVGLRCPAKCLGF
jgi:hypothetical protein